MEESLFENEVRRIARHLWPGAAFDGALIIEGRERNGIFVAEDCIHLIEATTSRKKLKAQQDTNKLASLAKKLQRQDPTKAIKCWFVTQEEPTPDQRGVVRREEGLVVALSFAQFQSKLIDAKSYLSARDNYPFGSVRDPKTESIAPSVGYIPMDLVRTGAGDLWDIERICKSLLNGECVLFLGDYGAGKSMTLREIYLELRKSYLKGRTSQFPIYLNLRDHHGQTNPAEVLERHARNIGFAHPSHLVRAWRAGYAILLLDGFDEITTLGWVGVWKKLRDVRYRSMHIIREFVQDTPHKTGLALAGRSHFFDGELERSKALSVTSFLELNLNNFTEQQVKKYLSKYGFDGKVPEWLPTRPLLLGCLVAKGLLEEISRPEDVGLRGVIDPAIGWDVLLDRIAHREAKIEAGIDGETVRRILERLATKARASHSGLGPLTAEQITDAFKEICGYAPDEGGMVLLQRLPGLGIDQEEEGTRQFIDEDLTDICRAGDVVEFVKEPFSFDMSFFVNAECAMHSLGMTVAENRLFTSGCSSGQLNLALRKATELAETSALAADLVRIAIEKQCDIESRIYVKNALIPNIELSQKISDLSTVEFQDCYFPRLEIDHDIEVENLPRFYRCYFAEVDGPVSEAGLPKGVFREDCVFDSFSQTVETTKAILDLSLPLGTRVMLTVLKKLYLQPGAGRKDNALCRGLDHRARRLVPDVLRLLQTEGLVTKYRRGGDETIWLPNRSEGARIRKMLKAPSASGDSLLRKSRDLE